jgi:hypothetical protein
MNSEIDWKVYRPSTFKVDVALRLSLEQFHYNQANIDARHFHTKLLWIIHALIRSKTSPHWSPLYELKSMMMQEQRYILW